jgi:serine/threonine-protein kinase RsbW
VTVVDVISDGATVEELRVRVPAVKERLQHLRRVLADWATRVGLLAETVNDLVLAAYEAMANVVEHAYRDQRTGTLDLHAFADLDNHVVTVTVTDHGDWRPPPHDPGLRGRGLSLIRGLTQHAAVDSGTDGTTVTMTFPMAFPLA